MSADADDPEPGSGGVARPRTTARQLTFDLAHEPSYDPDDFLVSPSNAAAHAMIEGWASWPDRILLLLGPPGSGKSHLGAIWARAAGARVLRATAALAPDEIVGPPVILLEDCDRAGHDERTLFHLLNLVRDRAGRLLVTARTVPDLWGLQTPDLLSRLRLAPVARIEPPDGALIRAVIVKLFADRQIRIEDDVVAYAARHCDQSLEAVSRFVAAVDEAALESGRRITRPLAAKTLSALSDDD